MTENELTKSLKISDAANHITGYKATNIHTHIYIYKKLLTHTSKMVYKAANLAGEGERLLSST